MPGFISTLSYETLQHMLPRDPTSDDVFLVPNEYSLPFPDICKPGINIPDSHLKKVNEFLKVKEPLSWEEFMAYWLAFSLNEDIQTIRYFKNEVIFIRYQDGAFLRDFASPLSPLIRRYRAFYPHKKDTDVFRACVRRDKELFMHPYTLEWIKETYQKTWDFEKLKPALLFLVRYYGELDRKVPLDTETYKTWCPKVNNE